MVKEDQRSIPDWEIYKKKIKIWMLMWRHHLRFRGRQIKKEVGGISWVPIEKIKPQAQYPGCCHYISECLSGSSKWCVSPYDVCVCVCNARVPLHELWVS
jgi:hypothetical protein